MVVAGHHRQLFDLRILLIQNRAGILGVFRGAEGFFLKNDATVGNIVVHQPDCHDRRLRDTLDAGGFTPGHRDIGVGVLPGCLKGHIQPVIQLRLHGAVLIQAVAKHHNTQGIVLSKIIPQAPAGSESGMIQPVPIGHNLPPHGPLSRGLRFKVPQTALNCPG